jgi:hypothetical protein|tara:strand:- start:362 stop:1804 length:1443 start_codon:yes stop_codon:yes gene_type:complete
MLKFNKLTLEPQWIDTNICFCGGGSDDSNEAGSDNVDRSNPNEMAAREAAAARAGTVTSGGGGFSDGSTVTSINPDGSRSAVTSGTDFEQAMAQESFRQSDPRASEEPSNFQAARMEGLMNSEQMALERAARAGKLASAPAAPVAAPPVAAPPQQLQGPPRSVVARDGLTFQQQLDYPGTAFDVVGPARQYMGSGVTPEMVKADLSQDVQDLYGRQAALANTGISSLAPSTSEEKSLVDTLLGNIEPGSLKADPNYNYQAPKEDFYADAYQDMYGQTAPGTNFYSVGSALGNSMIPTLARSVFGGEAPRSGADEAAFQAGQMFNLASRGMTREEESDLYSGKTDMFDAETGKFSDVPVGTRGGTLDTNFLGLPVYSGMYDPYYKGGPFENLVNPSQEMQGGASDGMSSVRPPVRSVPPTGDPNQPPADVGDLAIYDDFGRPSSGQYVVPTDYSYVQNPTISPNPFLRSGQGIGSLFYRNV